VDFQVLTLFSRRETVLELSLSQLDHQFEDYRKEKLNLGIRD